jgi:hypothetical protein
MWNYDIYIQLLGLLGRGGEPVATYAEQHKQ